MALAPCWLRRWFVWNRDNWDAFLGNLHSTFRAEMLFVEIWLRVIDTPFTLLILMEDTHLNLYPFTPLPFMSICKQHSSTFQLLYYILFLPGVRVFGMLHWLKTFLNYIRAEKPWKLFCPKGRELFSWTMVLFVLL